MRNELIQGLGQQQKLVMTTEMQLLLKFLQMPITELQEYINNEMQENPILEVEDTTVSEDLEPNEDKNLLLYKEIIRQSEYGNNSFENERKYSNPVEEISPFNYIIEKKSLKSYLKSQLIECNESILVMSICDYIIESLNDRGYLEYSIEDMSNELGVNTEIISYCLNIIQRFEPSGIGARSLSECLKIQLKNRGMENKNLELIIDEYLELMAGNKLKEIGKLLNIDILEAQKYCNIIKSLEPKPARGFYTGENTKYILPDAYIRKIGDEYFILINDSMIPKLSINYIYKDIIKKEENNETTDYLREKLNNAVLLIRGIEQRRNTMYNILKCIIDIQEDCLERGLAVLKPMSLKDIASNLDIHESTVSRAIRDKYIYAPFGTVKIKNLFSNGIVSCTNDEKISAVKIKQEIKRLIDDEDKTKPISDKVISESLELIGIKISRRTVGKYREELGIKASKQRKVFN